MRVAAEVVQDPYRALALSFRADDDDEMTAPGGRASFERVLGEDVFIELEPNSHVQRLEDIHPDLLLLVIMLVIGALRNPSVHVPVAPSDAMAEAVEEHLGVKVVTDSLGEATPRVVKGHRAGLAFSGGIDSCAAVLVLPPDSVNVLMLRDWGGVSPKTMYRPEAALASVDSLSRQRRAMSLRSNVETIRTPVGFPVDWSNCLPLVLNADSLELSTIAFGMVMESAYSLGKQKYSNLEDRAIYRRWAPVFDAASLSLSLPTAGLSEVATSTMVHAHGSFMGAQSCVRGQPGKPCGICYKCFRKSLFDSVILDREVDAGQIERATATPEVKRRLLETPIHHEIGLAWAMAHIEPGKSQILAALKGRTAPIVETGSGLDYLQVPYKRATKCLVDAGVRTHVAMSLEELCGVATDLENALVEGWDMLPILADSRYQDGVRLVHEALGEQFDARVMPWAVLDAGTAAEQTAKEQSRRPPEAAVAEEVLTDSAAAALGELRTELESVRELVHRSHRAVLRELGRLPGDVVGLARTVDSVVPPSGPVPPVGGYALRTHEVTELVSRVKDLRAANIVECGSGSSTAWLALALPHGLGRVHALEDDESYLEQTHQLLEALGCRSRVDLHHAPLEHGASGLWYTQSVLDKVPMSIDLLFIDGPASRMGADIRRPALDFLVPRVRPGGVVVLDDTNRKAEREIAKLLLASTEYALLRDNGTSVVIEKVRIS